MDRSVVNRSAGDVLRGGCYLCLESAADKILQVLIAKASRLLDRLKALLRGREPTIGWTAGE
jgi:hypothetical protein